MNWDKYSNKEDRDTKNEQKKMARSHRHIMIIYIPHQNASPGYIVHQKYTRKTTHSDPLWTIVVDWPTTHQKL